ncbi:MAG: DUF169 domain-containing protein, partial [Candidatus Bathyarchaeota archaeon]|nr:DUF169 domain-containing protein [Candidatus Bathyarchaeota archaeon]
MLTLDKLINEVEKITKVLKLSKNPIGVRFMRKKEVELLKTKIKSKFYTVCGGILNAAEGETVLLSKESCICPGGRYYLGFVEKREIPLSVLVDGEKLWYNKLVAYRSDFEAEKLAKIPYRLAENIALYPLTSNIKSFYPDIVLMLVNAEQASRLLLLNQFWDGKTAPMEMRLSLCWSTITYPAMSGNFNISVGDISARKMEGWDPNLMVASIPVERMKFI